MFTIHQKVRKKVKYYLLRWVATYAIYKYFKLITNEKLNEAYYQRDHLWTGSRVFKELYKIMFISKEDVEVMVSKTSTLAS